MPIIADDWFYQQALDPDRKAATMASIDKRLSDLENRIDPEINSFEVRNERGEVIFRNEYSPAAGKWITTIERPDLRTESETHYYNDQPVYRLIGISILDL